MALLVSVKRLHGLDVRLLCRAALHQAQLRSGQLRSIKAERVGENTTSAMLLSLQETY